MFKLFKIDGYSLYPLFKEGEIVFSRKIYSFEKIKINDIVVFNHEKYGKMIKKVFSIENNRFFLKGENVHSIDSRDFGLVNRKEIQYKVLFKVKRV